jgi:hypothetical protein
MREHKQFDERQPGSDSIPFHEACHRGNIDHYQLKELILGGAVQGCIDRKGDLFISPLLTPQLKAIWQLYKRGEI